MTTPVTKDDKRTGAERRAATRHAGAAKLHDRRTQAGITRAQLAAACGCSLFKTDNPKTDDDLQVLVAALDKLIKAQPAKKTASRQALAKHEPPNPKAEDGGSSKPGTKKAAPKPTGAKKTTTTPAAKKGDLQSA
jgi:hypothetical protein